MKPTRHEECRIALVTASAFLWRRITRGHFIDPEEVRAAVAAHKAIEKAVNLLDGPLSQQRFKWSDEEAGEGEA